MYHLNLSHIALAVFFLCSSVSIAQRNSSSDLFFPPRVTASIPSLSLQIRETSRWMFPLPVLYFDGAGSTNIPESYQIFSTSSQADVYTDTSATYAWTHSLQKYYQLLNIVGYRMRVFPETCLELEGGYSAGTDESPRTAMMRAETVREYLNGIWGISMDRIELRKPKQFCTHSDPEYMQEEARAVRFHSQNPELFSRICYRIIQRRMAHSFFQMEIRVNPWERRENIDSVVISVFVGDSLLSRSVLGRPPEEYGFSARESQATGNVEDIPIYTLLGQWLVPQQIEATQDGPLEVRTTVHLKSGEIRAGNTLRKPIQIQHEPESPHYTTWILLPGFEDRDTALTRQQEQWIDEILTNATKVEIQGSSIEAEDTTTSGPIRRGRREKYTQTIYLEIESETGPYHPKDPDTYYHSQYWPWDCLILYYKPTGDTALPNDRARAIQSRVRQQNYSALTAEVEDGTITADPEEFDLPEERAYLRNVSLTIQPPLER